MTQERPTSAPLQVTLFSFGFKHAPPEAEMVWDVRFLPNPFWVPELKSHTGLEKQVSDYVLDNNAGHEFIQLFDPLLRFILKQFHDSKKERITIAVGCTGGRHRSVAVTEHLRQFLAPNRNLQLTVFHRDIEKE